MKKAKIKCPYFVLLVVTSVLFTCFYQMKEQGLLADLLPFAWENDGENDSSFEKTEPGNIEDGNASPEGVSGEAISEESLPEQGTDSLSQGGGSQEDASQGNNAQENNPQNGSAQGSTVRFPATER